MSEGQMPPGPPETPPPPRLATPPGAVPSPRSGRLRRRSPLGFAAALLGALLATPVGLALLALLLLQTPVGTGLVAGLARDAAAASGYVLTVEGLDGPLPFAARLARLTVADQGGVFLTADEIAFDWNAGALAGGTAHIEALTVGRLALARAPLPSAEPQPPGEPGPLIPRLPVDLRIDRLALARVELGPALLALPPGTLSTVAPSGGAVLTAEARAVLTEDLEALLHVERLDAPGTVDLDLRVAGATERVTLTGRIAEPPGGVIARLAAIPGLPAVALSLDGGGTLDDATATLRLEAGPEVTATGAGRLAASPDGGRAFAVTLDAAVPGLLSPAIAPLATPTRLVVEGTLAADGTTLSLSRAALAAPGGSVTVTGGATLGDAPTLDLTGEAALGERALYAGVVPGAISWTAAGVRGRVAGPLAGGGVAQFDLAGAAVGLTLGNPQLDPLLAQAATLAARGTYDGAAGLVTLDAAAVRAGDVVASGSGTARLRGEGAPAADLTLTADVPGLARFGSPAGGAAALSALVAYTTTPAGPDLRVTLDGGVSDLTWPEARTAALLGGRLDIDGTVFVTPADSAPDVPGAVSGLVLRAEGLRIAGARVAVAGDASLSPGGSLDGAVVLTADDLRAVDPRLAGAARIEADLAGTAAAPRVTLSGGGALGGRRLDVAGTLRPEPGLLHVEQLRAGFGSAALTADGRLALGSTTPLLTGEGRFRAGRLGDLAPLTGLELAGSADLSLTAAAADGRQTATLSGTAADLAVAGTQIERLALDLALRAGGVLDARVEAEGLVAGGAPISSVTLTAAGPPDDLDVTVATRAPRGTADLAATVAQEPAATRITLTRFQGRAFEQTVRLRGPATITVAQGITLSDLSLDLAGGRLTAEGSLTGSRIALDAELQDLPLAIVGALQATLAAAPPGSPPPDPEAPPTTRPNPLQFGGTADATVSLSGTLAAPEGTAELVLTDARFGPPSQGLPPIDARISAVVDRTARITGTIAGAGPDPLRITATLPLQPSPDAPVQGRVTGIVDLAAFGELLSATGDRLAGTLDIDLSADGTVGAPNARGAVTLQNVAYENLAIGLRLLDLTGRLDATRDQLQVSDVAGRTPGGGRVFLSGGIGLRDPLPVDIAVSLDGALIADSDLVRAVADARLRAEGTLTERVVLTGEVTLLETEFYIPDPQPATAREIDVTEVNLPPGRTARQTETPQEVPPRVLEIALDLLLRAPTAVRVTGCGLEAELAGQLDIDGTTNAPLLTGGFAMRRGQLDLLGQVLTFDRGEVSFRGTQRIDPVLDFLASTPTDEGTVSVAVTGTASDPKIALSSEPELPQDEILAQLLFGRVTGGLSAGQAVQIASAAASLAGGCGGGPGFMDDLRRNIGLDRLDFDVEGGTLEAGRYIGENIYLGVEGGLAADSNRVTVDIKIDETFTVETGVGAGGGDIGISAEWDY